MNGGNGFPKEEAEAISLATIPSVVVVAGQLHEVGALQRSVGRRRGACRERLTKKAFSLHKVPRAKCGFPVSGFYVVYHVNEGHFVVADPENAKRSTLTTHWK
jgi:hypothetical protein